ncbi:8-oxo-dGTP diphosphatase MutT [Porticoccaceae bacterium]|nr:8-oxo-dGTP diphosphatase MutT [Porticoccaceae bacterium]
MLNTAPDKKRITVAAAVILDDQQRCLISYRHRNQHQGELWEFPGGKLEPGESAEQALARELKEELGIAVVVGKCLRREQHDYSDKSVELTFFEVTQWQGDPIGCEGQPLKWVPLLELQAEQFPAANRALVAQLRNPCD